MPHNRFFLDASLTAHQVVELTGEEAHHLARVMRGNVGDRVELVNGQNQRADATVQRIEKRGVVLAIDAVEERSSPPFSLILCQAIPRLNRLETIVEKGTELGMTELWLFPGDHSEKKELSANQAERLRHIAIAAMKQSGRLDLPTITIKKALGTWSNLPYPSYYGDINPEAPPFLAVLTEKMAHSLLFFVGPEAGFSEREEEALQRIGSRGVRLHQNILRTDTAPLAAFSLISNLFLTKY